MWDQTFKRWIDLVFWWLPKHEAAEPASQASEPAADSTPTQTVRGQAAASDAVPDDLTVIKGIGPVVQEKLHALGIRTFGELAAADPERLAEQLKGRQPISAALVRGWTEAADQRTAARH
jgi:predicted flap endonuclease-1-like 5' DNA nuclease